MKKVIIIPNCPMCATICQLFIYPSKQEEMLLTCSCGIYGYDNIESILLIQNVRK